MTARERLIKAYTSLIGRGEITIDSVPESIRSEVEAALNVQPK